MYIYNHVPIWLFFTTTQSPKTGLGKKGKKDGGEHPRPRHPPEIKWHLATFSCINRFAIYALLSHSFFVFCLEYILYISKSI